MVSLLILGLMLIASVLSGEPVQMSGIWHLNRQDCILADLVPKVSQRIKLLEQCVNNPDIEHPPYSKHPYLGWKHTPILEVWDMTDYGSQKEEEQTEILEKINNLSEVTGTFTEYLYKNLEVESPNVENVAVSPLALEVALAAVAVGAKSDTWKEITRVLRVTSNSLPLKYRSIVDQLQMHRHSSIQMVNKLYLEQAFFPVNEEFNKKLLSILNTKIEKANFHVGSVAEIEKINAHVADKTEGRIKDAVTPETVNDHTKLLLVNTLYFKAEWENQFVIKQGFNGDFHLPGEKSVKATYMSRDEIYYHYKESEEGQYRMLEMPYLSSTDDPGLFSMIVILPNEVDGLEKVEQHLTKDHSWLKDFDLVSSRDTAVVRPKIPRFTIDLRVDLKNALNKMGVVLMFEDTSDFRGINGRRDIKTSKIQQRIYLDVNEKGSTISSRTKSSQGAAREISTKVKEFYANHPFVFAIVQRVTKSVLLMGHVTKPNYDDLFAQNSEDLKSNQ